LLCFALLCFALLCFALLFALLCFGCCLLAAGCWLARAWPGWLVNELQEGDLMKSGMVGRVHSSKHGDFKEGQSVFCYGHWATLTQVDPADRKAQVLKLPEPEQLAVKPSAYLGALVNTRMNTEDDRTAASQAPAVRAPGSRNVLVCRALCVYSPCLLLLCRACRARRRTSG
jgi:hypothetical protein